MSWQERTELLFGKEKLEKLRNSKILICGLGGVGGAAIEQLVRAGAENITAVDADVISKTNINRQIIATYSNIGELKTIEFEKRLRNINPDLNLTLHNVFLKDETLENIVNNSWDYVIDAIDTLSPKLNLIRTCYQNNIPLISSMGSGGKTNPLCITIDDISNSYNCGLARMLRKRLRRLGIYEGIEVVFSTERTDKSTIIEEESECKKSNAGTISYMPIVFGCICAYAAIRKIVEID